jgi:4Fe-4S ferredoxin
MQADFKALSFIGKIKTRVHGNKKAYVVQPDLCHACGLCVTACPEKAIKLKKV